MDLVLLAAVVFAARRSADTHGKLASFVVLSPGPALACRLAALGLLALWTQTTVPTLPSLLVLASAGSLLLAHLQAAQTLFGLLSSLAWAVGYGAVEEALSGQEPSRALVLLAAAMALAPLLRLLLGNGWRQRSLYLSSLGLLLLLCCGRLPHPALAPLLSLGPALPPLAAVAVHASMFLLLHAVQASLGPADGPGASLGFDLAEDLGWLSGRLRCCGLGLGRRVDEAMRVAVADMTSRWRSVACVGSAAERRSESSPSRISEAEAILFVQRSLQNSKTKRAP